MKFIKKLQIFYQYLKMIWIDSYHRKSFLGKLKETYKDFIRIFFYRYVKVGEYVKLFFRDITHYQIHRVKYRYLHKNKVWIYTSRPGIIIGRKGKTIKELQQFITNMLEEKELIGIEIVEYDPFCPLR